MTIRPSLVDYVPANQCLTETPVGKMVRLRNALETMRYQFQAVPDDTMDTLTDTVGDIERQIIASESECFRDVAAKFRLAAAMIEEGDDGGQLVSEPAIVYSALHDLAKLRGQAWEAIFQRTGRSEPHYNQFLLQEEQE